MNREPMHEFITRREWGARAPEPGPGYLTPSRVKGIALHWPGGGDTNSYDTHAEVCASLRGWQRYHMDDRGWSDIAYQSAVDQRGNVYRLRGLRVQSAANGDTATNETYGALLLILGLGEHPTEAMVKAVRRRVADFRNYFPGARNIVGHNQIRPEPTACPGPKVQALIRSGAFNPIRKD